MTVNIEALRRTATYAEEALVVDAQAILQTMMDEKGMNRAGLAAAMGVSRARVTQLFSGECKNFTIRLLARAFFALGERVELTCEHHRKQQLRAERIFVRADDLASWSFSFDDAGPVNDNTFPESDAVEIASAPNDRRVTHLVSTLSRALQRERAA